MQSPTTPTCDFIDDTFGPWAGQCRGGFDFTLLFEEAILAIPLLSIFILILPFRLFQLTTEGTKVVSSRLPKYKLIATLCWLILQLALLVVWASTSGNSKAFRTRATIPTSSLSFVVSLGFTILSWYEHKRSVRPALILELYLYFSVLFDIARARTLWLLFGHHFTIPALFTCTVGIRCVLIVLESTEKRRILLPPYSRNPKETISGSLSRGIFFWLTSLFLNGYKSILSLDDLFPLDEKLRTEALHERLRAAWDKEPNKKKGGSLLFAWIRVQKWDIIHPVFWRLCSVGFTFSQPFLVTKAIALASAPASGPYNNSGSGLIGAYALMYFGIAVSNGQYYHQMNRAAVMMRGAVVSCIFGKTLSIQPSDTTSATALSLTNTDIQTIIPGITHMHEVWAGLIEIAISIYLLYRQVGAACSIPIAFSFFVIIVSGFIAVPAGTSQAAWIASAQQRVASTSYTLGKIQSLRISDFNELAFSKIQKLRDEELRVSRKLRLFTMWILTFVTCTPIFSPVLTFITFSLLALRNNDILTISKIFTSLSLFVLFSAPLSMIIFSLPNLAAATTSFQRIQDYLNTEEHEDIRNIEFEAPRTTTASLSELPILSSLENSKKQSTVVPNSAVELQPFKSQKATRWPTGRSIVSVTGKFTWSEGQQGLEIDEVHINRATLTIVLGPVGSGKSTLLKCMVGEVPCSFDGKVQTSYSGIAYCDQIPFLPNSTIRELITSDSEFESQWFSSVVAACCLEEDLQQWPQGELSIVGSKGLSLSGGQKQRLAMARAVYSRKEFVVLDDSFSGLDSRTEAKVFDNLLGKYGVLRGNDVTVVLASSSASRASYADHVILLGDDDGTVVAQGTFRDISLTIGSGFGDVLQASQPRGETDIEIAPRITNVPDARQSIPLLLVETYTDSRRQTGDSAVYKFYLGSAGWKSILIFIASMLVFAFCDTFPNFWLKWWAEANSIAPNEDLEKWLTVYASLAVGSMIFLLIGTWQVFMVCLTNSGVFFHDLLVKTVSGSTMTLFTTVDIGITMNRFSQDLQLIDMELPATALGVAVTFVFCMASAIIMSVASKYFAVVIPFILVIYYLIQHFYLRTSRQMRFLDIEHKAPLYSQLIETLNGLITTRAFKWQQQAEKRNWSILDDSQQPVYLLFCLQQLLIFSVNMVVAFMAIILISLTTTLREQISPGYMGIAMINIIGFGETSKALIHTWVGLEISIGAVARIKNFVADTEQEEVKSEDSSEGNDFQLPENWPSLGEIQFTNVSAAYPTTGPILQNTTLSIIPGEKVGICGRTGSGKSSLVQTLLHMLPITEGSITIDSIPLALVSPSEIRNRLVAVFQEPYIFPSTIRENLDHSSLHTDTSIIAALQTVQLWESSILPRGGLEAQIDDKFFSHGQAQLFSLARALLRKPKILILDEVTSSLDAETEAVVKRVLESDVFAVVTVLAVAHRLEFIKDFDRVVVLERGRIVEVGEPKELMRRTDGKWRGLVAG